MLLEGEGRGIDQVKKLYSNQAAVDSLVMLALMRKCFETSGMTR